MQCHTMPRYSCSILIIAFQIEAAAGHQQKAGLGFGNILPEQNILVCLLEVENCEVKNTIQSATALVCCLALCVTSHYNLPQTGTCIM